MIIKVSVLAFLASILSSRSLVFALSSLDIPSDIPISSLLASGNAHLAKGETNHALTYYDVAISRDPNNYLTFFKRGATYLSLGRITQAQQDFEKALVLKPGFEGALLQRGKIRKMYGEWGAAVEDFVAAGETDVADLLEAQGAAALAVDAEKNGNWEECVTQAGVAIMVAGRNLSLRQARARCRFERGEVEEGISDLMHVLQMQPGLTDPHLQISAILFYALENMEQGVAQIRKCLHSDPELKSCKKLHKKEKTIIKTFAKIKASMERKQFAGAAKLLVPTGEDPGLIQEIKDDVKELRDANTVPARAPNKLVALAVEMACEAYTELEIGKKATTYCEEALNLNEFSLYGLLSKAQQAMDAEEYEACISTLKTAKEHHSGAQKIDALLRKAEIALKRSKEKDYYKVLSVPHDADELQIKSAYRKLTKLYHPDKAIKSGVTKEQAEKKMAAINEAYEVLSDPELKARFDRGDDPNSHEGHGQHFQGNPFGGGHHFFFQQGPGDGSHGEQQHFQFQRGFPFG